MTFNQIMCVANLIALGASSAFALHYIAEPGWFALFIFVAVLNGSAVYAATKR